jgi:Fe-S oxidoreductase
LACAAVLDPRYKLNLISYCFRKIYGVDATQHVNGVVALLHRLLAEYKQSFSPCPAANYIVKYHAKDYLFDDYAPQEQISELDWYLGSPAMDLNTDLDILGVLEWHV